MREIKFRAWNGAEMTYDVVVGRFGAFYVNPGDKGDGLDPNDSASLTPFNTRYSEITPVMQYTGLKAKGVEIYEGDICRSKLHGTRPPEIWKVIYEPRNGAYCYKARNGIINPLTHAFSFGRELEVIGNIYEHGYLLESKESR